MRAPLLHAKLVRALETLRRSDGGFPASTVGLSEVEPTAVAALALGGDDAARGWLVGRQGPGGGFVGADGRVEGPTTAALASLALERPAARRALRFAVAQRGLPLPGANDPRPRGWGWTADTRSFVEPTARVLIAAKRLTPGDRRLAAEGTGLLEEWQCSDGGWNHGVSSVLDAELPGYAQTTAIALVALQGENAPFVRRGLSFLRRSWPREPGAMTTAQAMIAFRLHAVAGELESGFASLGPMMRRPSFLERPVAVAWAALATGPDELLDSLRAAS